MTSPIRVAIVGCGAVSVEMYVPAILARNDIRVTAAVDRNPARAQMVAGVTGALTFANVSDALPHIDAAIVALPHHLHAPCCIELLDAGKPVLVEKPMAIATAECEAMIAASRRAGVSLSVGQLRRFCPAVSVGKALIERGVIGRVERFEIREGGVYDWPVASDFFFHKETAGGGVLMDTGAHVFDMLIWYFGWPAEINYRDDSYGGVEADCAVTLKTADGAAGYVELSRTHNLPTLLNVEGSGGSIAVDYIRNSLALRIDGLALPVSPFPIEHPSFPRIDIWTLMLVRQLENWVKTLRGEPSSSVDGEEGMKAVRFIERCYQERQLLDLPWVSAGIGAAQREGESVC